MSNETISEVVRRLSNSTENLTVTGVYNSLKTPSSQNESYYNKRNQYRRFPLWIWTALFSELGQPETLFICIRPR
jgi:hypothetical protein